MVTFRKLWLFLAAAILAFTTLFAVGCADEEATKGCTNGHTYGEWQVAKEATETSFGDRKRACSVCGSEEHEEIPMLSSISAAVNMPDLLKKGNGVNIVIDPFEFTVTMKSVVQQQDSSSSSATETAVASTSVTTETTEVKTKASGYAYAGINDEGFIYAYGKLTADMTTETNNTPVVGQTIMSFLLDEGEVYYLYNVYSKNDDGEFVIVESACEQGRKSIEELLEVPEAQTIVQIVFGQTDELIEFVNTNLRPFVEDVAESLGLNDEEAQKRALSMILKETKTGDVYELVNRKDIFQSIANDICDMTASALIDKYCGEGTFAQIERMPEMLDVTVGDVIEELAEEGVTLAKITEIADKAIQSATGDETATLESMLGTDLATFLEQYKDYTLAELFLNFGSRPQEPQEEGTETEQKAKAEAELAEIKQTMNAAIASLKTTTLPKLIAGASDGEVTESQIKLVLKAVAAEFDKGISVKVTLDSTRTITGFEMSISKDVLTLLSEAETSNPFEDQSGSGSSSTLKTETAVTYDSAAKISVSFGAENAANKTDFNADEFLKQFSTQTETDDDNGGAGNNGEQKAA